MSKAWLEKAFDSFSAEIFAYLRLMLRDEGLAEDVLQNIFLRAHQYQRRGNLIEKMRPFLFQVARREAWREMKKQKNFIATESTAILEVTEESPLSSLDAICLEESLKALVYEQREIIYLKIYGNFTFQEIASMLNIPINTAASRYRYAIEKMKELMGGNPNETK